MTVHGLRPEFQPSNFATQSIQNTQQTEVQNENASEDIEATTGEHEGIPSLHVNPAEITGLGQGLDIQA